jgi:hypothetical protein
MFTIVPSRISMRCEGANTAKIHRRRRDGERRAARCRPGASSATTPVGVETRIGVAAARLRATLRRHPHRPDSGALSPRGG